MSDMKPCPHCGEVPNLEYAQRITDGPKWGAIWCGCTEVRTGYEPFEKWRDAAVKEWNTRHNPAESALNVAREAIENAPHTAKCDERNNRLGFVATDPPPSCTCWKSSALASFENSSPQTTEKPNHQ